MPHTQKSTVLATYIQGLVETNKVTLDVDNVLYGLHENIPGGKTVTVTPATKTRVLDGVAMPGGRTMNEMPILINVYLNIVIDEETGRLIVDQLAESIEDLLHQNTTMGGLIFHGFVTTWEPGIRYRTGSMFRTVQMTFVGRSKTNLTP